MKLKYVVGVVMILFSLFMCGVFIWGFAAKQQKEAEVKNLQNNQTSSQPAILPDQTQQPTADPNSKTYTVADVAQHNSPKDCWLIIQGKVYDVGSFLDQHPGGTDVIIPYCGKDATQAFETQGGRRSTHSQTARQLLQGYLVGTLQQ